MFLILLLAEGIAVGSHGSYPTARVVGFLVSLAATAACLVVAVIVGSRELRNGRPLPAWEWWYGGITASLLTAAVAVAITELGYGGDALPGIADLLVLLFFGGVIGWNLRIRSELAVPEEQLRLG
jgi:hypothetical protein